MPGIQGVMCDFRFSFQTVFQGFRPSLQFHLHQQGLRGIQSRWRHRKHIKCWHWNSSCCTASPFLCTALRGFEPSCHYLLSLDDALQLPFFSCFSIGTGMIDRIMWNFSIWLTNIATWCGYTAIAVVFSQAQDRLIIRRLLASLCSHKPRNLDMPVSFRNSIYMIKFPLSYHMPCRDIRSNENQPSDHPANAKSHTLLSQVIFIRLIRFQWYWFQFIGVPIPVSISIASYGDSNLIATNGVLQKLLPSRGISLEHHGILFACSTHQSSHTVHRYGFAVRSTDPLQ